MTVKWNLDERFIYKMNLSWLFKLFISTKLHWNTLLQIIMDSRVVKYQSKEMLLVVHIILQILVDYSKNQIVPFIQ